MSTRTATRPRRSLQYRAIPPDPIDVLDNTCPGGFYHHSGPYDATLLSRNLHPKTSPVAAVADSNKAALAATPREFVTDSLTKHVPLQGTASVPPGGQTLDGGIMEYEDGTDMMREDRVEGGAYKRWAGISYHPDDLKGKGEPSYTLEEAEKSRYRKGKGKDSYEMRPYPGSPRRRHEKRSAGDKASRHSGSGFRPDGSKGLRRRLGDLKRKGT